MKTNTDIRHRPTAVHIELSEDELPGNTGCESIDVYTPMWSGRINYFTPSKREPWIGNSLHVRSDMDFDPWAEVNQRDSDGTHYLRIKVTEEFDMYMPIDIAEAIVDAVLAAELT